MKWLNNWKNWEPQIIWLARLGSDIFGFDSRQIRLGFGSTVLRLAFTATASAYRSSTLAVDGWAVTKKNWYSKEGTSGSAARPRLLLVEPNATPHQSTTSVPITVLLYNGPLLYGFNVPIKGLSLRSLRCNGGIMLSPHLFLVPLSRYLSRAVGISLAWQKYWTHWGRQSLPPTTD